MHINFPDNLITRTVRSYASFRTVEAVVLGGSRSTQSHESGSDLDLYVYCRRPLDLALRKRVPGKSSDIVEFGNKFWEPGDEWIDWESGIHLDVMMRTTAWIEKKLDDVLKRHIPQIGYTTCLWHSVRESVPLFDRRGWFRSVQQRAHRKYPEPLVRAIIARNYPILFERLSGYGSQIRSAIQRKDLVSLHHRTAAFLASYFDIIFAANRVTHPGEKRLLMLAEASCSRCPRRMRRDVEALIRSVGGQGNTMAILHSIMDNLNAFLKAEALLPNVSSLVGPIQSERDSNIKSLILIHISFTLYIIPSK